VVECPGCGATYELGRVQKTAAEFCAGCDYPLFWATRRAPIDEAETDASEGLAPTLRRRPGAAGLPIGSSNAPAAWLASPVTTARWLIAHLIEPLAWLLLALVLLATARLGAERAAGSSVSAPWPRLSARPPPPSSSTPTARPSG
jgi:hypothetical protein